MLLQHGTPTVQVKTKEATRNQDHIEPFLKQIVSHMHEMLVLLRLRSIWCMPNCNHTQD